MSATNVESPRLQAFLDAFNAHDVDAGEPIEVRGCDLFEFADGKISRKDSFWKIVD